MLPKAILVQTKGFELPIQAENWLKPNRCQAAELLTEQTDAAYLSEQKTTESTGQYLTYHYNDLVVIDRDTCLVVGGQATIVLLFIVDVVLLLIDL